ncbi:hypothetical protein [Sphingobacterium sp. 40-24]|uniref:hypothetical protein n=1 Tax=Sphingobacterium sp. 40-24 TaxID=1895843 RepID=UPI00095CD570|nr:hypothetical protein [Sphingobacterium sp. 40-24]OJZ00039.1 MAG: hypothetical protein BGP15_00085 [Sphingobacterium sp. 40-24]
MKPKCNYNLALERTLYHVHESDYDPLKDTEAFWKQYSIGLIRDNLIELQSKVNSEQLSGFSLALLKALAAYLIAHVSNLDLTPLSLSEVFETSKEELKAPKEISDFFRRVSSSNTNS